MELYATIYEVREHSIQEDVQWHEIECAEMIGSKSNKGGDMVSDYKTLVVTQSNPHSVSAPAPAWFCG